MHKYDSIREFSKILGVSAQTLKNWDKEGKRANKAKRMIRELTNDEKDL